MASRVVSIMLIIVAVIHVLPLAGVLGVSQLASLYAISIHNTNLEILMRHRAVLFGIVGLFFAYAAFKPVFQPVSFVMAFVSITTFLFLAISVGDLNPALRTVFIADLVALAALLIAVVSYYFQRRRN